MFEQPGGSHGRCVGVHAFVNDMVYAQVTSAGGARELPDTRGTAMGVGRWVERGFHVGQRGELDGNVHALESVPNVLAPGAGADQSGTEFVGLAKLESQASGGVAQRAFAHSLGPQGQNPALFRREIVPFSRSQCVQHLAVAGFELVYLALLRAPAGAGLEPDDLVDDVQVPVVMEKARVRVHFRIHASPEADGRLQLGRPGEGGDFGGRCRRAGESEGDEQQQKAPAPCLPCIVDAGHTGPARDSPS